MKTGDLLQVQTLHSTDRVSLWEDDEDGPWAQFDKTNMLKPGDILIYLGDDSRWGIRVLSRFGTGRVSDSYRSLIMVIL